MSIVAICIVLGVFVALMVKTRAVKLGGALLCIAFGITLAASPIGLFFSDVLHTMGTWVLTQLRAV